MHVAQGWGKFASTVFVTSLACMSSSDFDARLETFQAQIDMMTNQGQRCLQELSAIGGSDVTAAGQLPGQPSVRVPAPNWKEMARRQHELEGARSMISRAAAIGPGALDGVISSLARAQKAYAELCRARDELATRAALSHVAAAPAAADARLGQPDR